MIGLNVIGIFFFELAMKKKILETFKVVRR